MFITILLVILVALPSVVGFQQIVTNPRHGPAFWSGLAILCLSIVVLLLALQGSLTSLR